LFSRTRNYRGMIKFIKNGFAKYFTLNNVNVETKIKLKNKNLK